MIYTLDDNSKDLLRRVADGVLLGIVDLNDGLVRLFPTPDQASQFVQTFNTHRQVIGLREVEAPDIVGFSICLLGGEIRWCSTISTLNDGSPGYVVDRSVVEQVMAALESPRHPEFRFFP